MTQQAGFLTKGKVSALVEVKALVWQDPPH